jgi:hypothetical protein
MTQILTTAQPRDEAEHCRRLPPRISDPLTKKLLAAFAEIYSTEADEQVASGIRW